MFDYRYNCLKVNAEYKPFGCVFFIFVKIPDFWDFLFFILPNLNGGILTCYIPSNISLTDQMGRYVYSNLCYYGS